MSSDGDARQCRWCEGELEQFQGELHHTRKEEHEARARVEQLALENARLQRELAVVEGKIAAAKRILVSERRKREDLEEAVKHCCWGFGPSDI